MVHEMLESFEITDKQAVQSPDITDHPVTHIIRLGSSTMQIAVFKVHNRLVGRCQPIWPDLWSR